MCNFVREEKRRKRRRRRRSLMSWPADIDFPDELKEEGGLK